MRIPSISPLGSSWVTNDEDSFCTSVRHGCSSELMGTRRTIPDVAYYMLRLRWSIESSAHFSVLDFRAFVVLFAERYFIIVCVSPSPAGDQSWWRCELFLVLPLNSLDRVGIFNDPHATVSHSWLTTPFSSLSTSEVLLRFAMMSHSQWNSSFRIEPNGLMAIIGMSGPLSRR